MEKKIKVYGRTRKEVVKSYPNYKVLGYESFSYSKGYCFILVVRG